MKNILLLVVLFLSVPAFSASVTNKEISQLKVQENGVVVKLSGFSNQEIEGSCSGSDIFFLTFDESDLSQETRISFLLAAYIAGKNVSITYYECEGSLIKLGSVTVI